MRSRAGEGREGRSCGLFGASPLIHGPFTSETLDGACRRVRTPNCRKRVVEASCAEEWAAMEPAGTNLGRFPSKFLLMVVPGLIASGVVASVLYPVLVSRAPSSSELLPDLTPQAATLYAAGRPGSTRTC